MDFCQRTPDVDYPCTWSYTVIGEDEAALRALIAELVGDLEHTLALSKRSKKGRYTSLALEVRVEDEAQRTGLYEALSGHAAVKIVL